MWALTRARIALWNKLGIIERRTPLQSWAHLSLVDSLQTGIPATIDRYREWREQHAPRFFFDDLDSIAKTGAAGQDSIRIAEQILSGEFPFFGYTQKLSFPPQWQQNPLNHAIAPGGHWSRIHEFASGDIKQWWEVSRFAWTFALCRAYANTRDERFAEAFWRLLESWLEQNPPQWGVNWKCGQEASFRVMALCFGCYVFAKSERFTAHRLARFVIAIAAHAKRIHAYTEYARSQKNNHGISEGVGLWTIGLLFPELQGAERWRNRGKQLIESETRRQIYADGSYIQHSTNYHRVMLQDLAWALRLGERNESRLAGHVYDGFRKGIRYLHALTDPHTGWAPNCGANDGALVLPLSDCAYPDMRPVLQSCHHIAEGERLYPAGPWNEEMVWLSGPASMSAKMAEQPGPFDHDSSFGGCYTIRSTDSWIMLKGTSYKDRPSHADQLHLDLWWRGENVLCDAGTYSYNAQAPFDDGFASTKYHNTVMVDGRDQMTRLSRFLWADWANASVRRFTDPSTSLSALEGIHDGYAKVGVNHRRTVFKASESAWMVVDDLAGNGERRLRLHWQLPDAPFKLVAPGVVNFQFAAGDVGVLIAAPKESQVDLVRAGERVAGESSQAPEPARGWHSRYYGRKEPALSLVAECNTSLPARFVTVIMLGKTYTAEEAASVRNSLLDAERFGLSAPAVSPIPVDAL